MLAARPPFYMILMKSVSLAPGGGDQALECWSSGITEANVQRSTSNAQRSTLNIQFRQGT